MVQLTFQDNQESQKVYFHIIKSRIDPTNLTSHM